MNIKPICTEADYAGAMARLDELWGAPIGSAEGDELEALRLLIGKYEDENFAMPPSDPLAGIKFRMEQQGLTAPALDPKWPAD